MTSAARLREEREPFGPIVVRTKRGVMHRAKPGPVVHVRCRGGRPFVGEVLTVDEVRRWATGREWALCRYPWCFRQVLRAAGIDPEVGHYARETSRRGMHPRPMREVRHKADPARLHDSIEGWAWCVCGRIVVRAERAHTRRVYWTHKSTGPAAAA